MALNLIRNSRVFFTTNTRDGVVQNSFVMTPTSLAVSGVVTVDSTTDVVLYERITVVGTNTGTGTGITAGVNYYVIAKTSTTITLSLSPNGTAITTTAGTLVGFTFIASDVNIGAPQLTITNTAGGFSVPNTSIGLIQNSDIITLVGTNSGTGSITGYAAAGVSYLVTSVAVGTTNTTFTLQTLAAAAIVTVAGTFSGYTALLINNKFSGSNTKEIQVLDGFSFSQNTNNEQVTISEAGTNPKRGQRSFNTSLAPVDFSFSTYMRPKLSTNVLCDESVLWNAMMSDRGVNIETTNTYSTTGTLTYTYSASAGTLTVTSTGSSTVLTVTGFAADQKYLLMGITSTDAYDVPLLNGPVTVESATTGTGGSIVFKYDNPSNSLTATPTALVGTVTYTGIKFYTSAWAEAPNCSILSGHNSNLNQLQKFGLIMVVDAVTYVVDNCALNEASIDFALDGISTIAWTGQATAIRQLSANTATTGTTSFTTTSSIQGSFTARLTDPNYITNKLTVCKLKTSKSLSQSSVAATTVTSTTVTTNIITVGSTTNMVAGQVIIFGTSIGGLTANTPYYILTVPSSTTLTVSTTPGGSAVTLSTATGGSTYTAIVYTVAYGQAYWLPITGGNVTISNNITYITPAILGVVNSPITYYTATRSVTGSLNAYLNTGTLNEKLQTSTASTTSITKGTGALLADMLTAASVETEPMFYLELSIGGLSSPKVELQMPSASLGIPAINTEQILSTTINFTSAGSTGNYSSRIFDLNQTNELTLRYYST